MVLVSHPTGTQSTRALWAYLSARNLLSAGITSLVVSPDWIQWLPSRIRGELSRRQFIEGGATMRQTQPLRELLRASLQRTRFSSWVFAEQGWLSITTLCAAHDLRTAKLLKHFRDIRWVYAYDDGAERTFAAARRLGVGTAYECPTSHWRTWRSLYEEEAALVPEWADTLPKPIIIPDKIRRKEAELSTADIIFCASSFAERSLRTHMGGDPRIAVVPYGAPAVADEPAKLGSSPKLKVLYIGRISQTKGLSYLSAAIRELRNSVELTLVGLPTNSQNQACRKFLGEHHWIPSLPHSALLECIRRHDVLVLPSLSEGFGLVLLEAMAQGLPVIGTVNSAAPDIVTHGVNGFVVPIRSSTAIASSLLMLARDRQVLKEMGQAARRTAESHSWTRYAERVFQRLAAFDSGSL